MKKKSIYFLALTLICYFSCHSGQPVSSNSSLTIKSENAVLLMYKIYSGCSTSILKNTSGKIDTLAKNVSYLCLQVKVNAPDISGDTTIITVFFEPESGYEIEDPKCDFAYSVGFVGSDNECDFIEFGDNYYTMTIDQYMKGKQNLDSIFFEKTKNLKCINSNLLKIINNRK